MKVRTDYQLVSALNTWAEVDAPESFDSSFLESVTKQFESHKELTFKQRAALENIVDKFEIDLDDYLDRR